MPSKVTWPVNYLRTSWWVQSVFSGFVSQPFWNHFLTMKKRDSLLFRQENLLKVDQKILSGLSGPSSVMSHQYQHLQLNLHNIWCHRYQIRNSK